MEKEKIKFGLVVGRFQPLHDGHRHLIKMAIEENNEIVVCIGSAQKADPLTVEERQERLQNFMVSLNLEDKKIKITNLEDVPSDEEWLSQLSEKINLDAHNKNTFYTADNLSEEYLNFMKNMSFNIKKIVRGSFKYKDPKGKEHSFFCATEIREIHKKFNLGKI